MKRIADIDTFLAVVEQGNLTAAARHLGRSIQAVSRSLAELERAMGVELVRRTTHRSHVTEAGLLFYQRVKPAVAEIEQASLEAAHRGTEPSGTIRIGASVLFAPIYLVPLIARFMQRHPGIEVDLRLSDRFSDLNDEGLDLAIRIGDLGDSDLKSRRLGHLRRVVFASPAYLEANGRPEHPSELAQHACIVRNTDYDPRRWGFMIEGKLTYVRISGRLRVDNTSAVHAAAVAGIGLGNAPLWQVRPLLEQGTIDIVLSAFELPPVPIHVVWPPTKQLALRTRLFIDELVAQMTLDKD